MGEILRGQRVRIERELARAEDPQRAFEFNDYDAEEQRQLKDNARSWRLRLEALVNESTEEPARIERSYVVRARRIEPVGLAYLWPVTG